MYVLTISFMCRWRCVRSTLYIYRAERADDRVPGCGRVSARTRDSVLSVYSGMESKRVQLFRECAECDG